MNGEGEALPSLGRYELVQLLGQGGMGEVYLAKMSGAAGFEKPVIVKTVLPSLLSDRTFLDRFHHEAKVLVHLVHSNIAQVFDMGEAHGTYFMALEYVPGVDLSALMESLRQAQQAMPLPVALTIGQKMAEGLGYAHRKSGPDGQALGIVHRDVSPQNVMVSYEGEVKVIDFGLAKSAGRSKYTLPATVMGKLGYMSPEQARAEPLDHRSDIYSCGVVVWEMLAGRPLVSNGTMGEMMAAMANPRPASLAQLRSDVSAELDEVVQKALAPRPEERYLRADEFARALNEQAVKLGTSWGAEELGNFVKGCCPEAFAQQRRLISSLSSGKRRPVSAVTGPITGLEPTTLRDSGQREALTGLEGTALRPSGPSTHTSEELAAIRPSRAPRVLGALVLVVALVAGAGWYFSRPPPQATSPLVPTPVESAQAVEVSPPSSPPPRPVPAPEPEPEVAEAPLPSAKSKPSQRVEREKRPPPRRVAVGAVAPLFKDGSSYFLRAGSAQGLQMGQVLEVVGTPGEGGLRPLWGQVTVLEVSPSLSRVRPDEGASGAKGKRWAALPLRASEPVKNAQRVPMPSAPVTPAVLTPSTPAPAAEKAEPAPPARLQGRVTVAGFGPLMSVSVLNRDVRDWTDCRLTMYGRRGKAVGAIPRGSTRQFQLRDFRVDASFRFVSNKVLGVDCKEGSNDFAARF